MEGEYEERRENKNRISVVSQERIAVAPLSDCFSSGKAGSPGRESVGHPADERGPDSGHPWEHRQRCTWSTMECPDNAGAATTATLEIEMEGGQELDMAGQYLGTDTIQESCTGIRAGGRLGTRCFHHEHRFTLNRLKTPPRGLLWPTAHHPCDLFRCRKSCTPHTAQIDFANHGMCTLGTT